MDVSVVLEGDSLSDLKFKNLKATVPIVAYLNRNNLFGPSETLISLRSGRV